MKKYKKYYKKHKRLIWLIVGVVIFDLLPLEFIVIHVGDWFDKVIFISNLMRTLAMDLSLTIKAVATLAGLALGLWMWKKN